MKNIKPFQVTSDSVYIPDILNLLQVSFAYMQSRVNPQSSMRNLSVETIKDQCVSGEVWAIGKAPYACIFLKEKHDCLYLGKLAVNPEARGHGYARRLVELAEERAISKGLPALELETRIELLENHATFQRLGFIKISEGAHDGFDRPTYIIMRKVI